MINKMTKQIRLADLLKGNNPLESFKHAAGEGVSIDPTSVDDDIYRIENLPDNNLIEFYEAALFGMRICHRRKNKLDSETYSNIADYIYHIRASSHKKS